MITRRREDFLASIVVNAYESGSINYWASTDNYQYQNHPDGKLSHAEFTITGDDGADMNTHYPRRVGMATIEHAMKTMRSGDVDVHIKVLADILAADALNDASEIDAMAADIIIQCALFGDVVFG